MQAQIRAVRAFLAIALLATLSLVYVPSAANASTTLSCSTGGVSYMTNKFWVTRVYVGGTLPWEFRITRTTTRTTWHNNIPTEHRVGDYRYYANGATRRTLTSSVSSFYYRSTYPKGTHRQFWQVTPSGGLTQYQSCQVTFTT